MISAVVLTKNSEKTLEKCLSSLSFCNEIIVIDDESIDDTEKIAKKMQAVVYKKKLENDFSNSRNLGLEKTKYEWVLFVDSDEEVPHNLAKEIKSAIEKTEYAGFYIRRIDVFEGKRLNHGETGKVRFVRLAKKEGGRWERRVHEKWNIKGNLGELQNAILHYPHQTVREFLTEINAYSTIHADELKKEGKKANIFTIITYPVGKFLQNYFIKLGVLDGIEGFIVAAMMSFHSFLSQGKLWHMQNKDS